MNGLQPGISDTSSPKPVNIQSLVATLLQKIEKKEKAKKQDKDTKKDEIGKNAVIFTLIMKMMVSSADVIQQSRGADLAQNALITDKIEKQRQAYDEITTKYQPLVDELSKLTGKKKLSESDYAKIGKIENEISPLVNSQNNTITNMDVLQKMDIATVWQGTLVRQQQSLQSMIGEGSVFVSYFDSAIRM
jgi:hypothetical protein